MLDFALLQVKIDALGRVVEIYTYTTVILVLVFISCLVVNKFSYRQMFYDSFILQHASVQIVHLQ